MPAAYTLPSGQTINVPTLPDGTPLPELDPRTLDPRSTAGQLYDGLKFLDPGLYNDPQAFVDTIGRLGAPGVQEFDRIAKTYAEVRAYFDNDQFAQGILAVAMAQYPAIAPYVVAMQAFLPSTMAQLQKFANGISRGVFKPVFQGTDRIVDAYTGDLITRGFGGSVGNLLQGNIGESISNLGRGLLTIFSLGFSSILGALFGSGTDWKNYAKGLMYGGQGSPGLYRSYQQAGLKITAISIEGGIDEDDFKPERNQDASVDSPGTGIFRVLSSLGLYIVPSTNVPLSLLNGLPFGGLYYGDRGRPDPGWKAGDFSSRPTLMAGREYFLDFNLKQAWEDPSESSFRGYGPYAEGPGLLNYEP